MVNFELANPAPENNKMAGTAVAGLEQGTLVTVNAAGEVVAADAADGLSGQAVGALLTAVIDPTDAKYGTTDFMQNTLKERRNVLVGDEKRAVACMNDMILEDADAEGTLTPGEPVYLAEGGGVTQAAPGSSGSIVQIVGIAEDADSYMLAVQISDEVNA